MTEKNHPTTKQGKNQDVVAIRGRRYMVQGQNYLCVAILDANGEWRSYSSNELLRGPVKVLYEV